MELSRVASSIALCVSVFLGTCRAATEDFNSDWRFLRGDGIGAGQPQFNDSAWRHIDLPHDWSIEDLPPRESDPLFATVTAVPGNWKFSAGDDASRATAGFDDSAWKTVSLPESWDKHGQTGVGWYRRHFIVPGTTVGKVVFLDLGVIDGHDWIYIDGEKVEESSDDYWANGSVMDRVIELTPRQSAPGDHIVSVKIKGPPNGGFTADVPPPEGPSPLDPGRSAGNISTGYAVGGIGWYRQHFTLPTSDAGKLVRVEFDGSYMETAVWINGVEIGRNRYGYSPFGFDITPHLKPIGEENVLAVKVVNLGKNSRWYSGSGLFRPVHLEITNPLRIAPWGVTVSTLEIRPEKAAVKVRIKLLNSAAATDAIVRLRILNPHDKTVVMCQSDCSVSSDGIVDGFRIDIPNPKLWSPASPALYRAEISVISGGETVDTNEMSFGIRSLSWDSEKGFQLNGETIKLRGGCIHHDFGPLGSASFPMAEVR